MRPMRISSEGPEVVPNSSSQSPDKYLVPLPFSETAHPFRYQQQKKFEDQEFEVDTPTGMLPSLPTSPRDFDPLPYASPRSIRSRYDAHHGRGNRGFGFLAVGLLVCLAFLIGGGIGGGVGGAIAVRRNAKVASLESSLASVTTVTTTAPASIQTNTIIDAAMCPNMSNRTYDSTVPGYQFLQICGAEIVPLSGTDNIDLSDSVQNSFGSCLDACASYNQRVRKGGCLGASWYIFWAGDPTRNSRCFLKSATSNTTSFNPMGIVASGFLTKEP